MAHDDMTEDELDMYKKLYALIGSRVKFNCDRIFYQGIVTSIITGLRMVTLRHASIVGGDYIGVIRCRFHEISSLTVVESKDVVNRYPRNDYLLNILRTKVDQKYIPSEVLYNDDLSDDEQSVCEENGEEEFVLDVPSHLENRLPSESAIIDCINESFEEAVTNILLENIVGVSFEGHQISRFGGISIICISTVSCVYIFDIEQLKKNAFDRGLRHIFESKRLKKVIHDCRFPSDCLAHLYSTQLTNVFDTQVADFVISMQCYNDKYEYKYVSSLDCCLRKYLQIPPEFLYNRVRGMSAAEKSALNTKRPISNDFKYDLTKNALYLILLQNTLAKELLGPLHRNVDAYLNIIANSSDSVVRALGEELSSPDSIPPSLLMNGIQTAKFVKPEKRDAVALVCQFKNPITGQIIKTDSDNLVTGKCDYSERPDESTNEKFNEDINHVTEKNSGHQKHTLLNASSKKMAEHSEQPDENFNEDINNVTEKNSGHQKHTLLNTSSKKISSVDPEKNTEAFDSIIVMPSISMRQVDEVYFKLVHNSTLRSHNAQSVINPKPADHYVSKFSVRKPFSDYKSMPESSKPNLDESVSIWTKLREESAPTSLLGTGKQKLRFVPAGMSH